MLFFKTRVRFKMLTMRTFEGGGSLVLCALGLELTPVALALLSCVVLPTGLALFS